MMNIDSFDTVYYTCIFLLPGFIINGMIDLLYPPSKSNDSKYFLSCLLYSIINTAAWSWLYRIIFIIRESHELIYWPLLILTTIIGASIIAMIIGISKQKNCMVKILNAFKIQNIHPIPNAWDYYFSKQKSFWVIVTLTDNRNIMGLYSSNSFASSDIVERDIYLEKIFDVDENNKWIEKERSKGVLITKEQIKLIEFFS